MPTIEICCTFNVGRDAYLNQLIIPLVYISIPAVPMHMTADSRHVYILSVMMHRREPAGTYRTLFMRSECQVCRVTPVKFAARMQPQNIALM